MLSLYEYNNSKLNTLQKENLCIDTLNPMLYHYKYHENFIHSPFNING